MIKTISDFYDGMCEDYIDGKDKMFSISIKKEVSDIFQSLLKEIGEINYH
jgi:hypothetical protein